MQTNSKIVVGCIVGLIMAVALLFALTFARVTLAASRFANDSAATQPEQVLDASAAIVKMDVPDGYAPSCTFAASGFVGVAYDHTDGRSHLYLMQTPDWLIIDPKTLARRLRATADREPLTTAPLIHVQDRAVTVRGQDATLSMDDGVNHEGVAWRQAAVLFKADGGSALLLLEEPVSRWDEARLQTLLSSIE